MFAWNFFKSPFCSWSCSGCCGGCPLLHLLQQLHYSPTPAQHRRKGMQVLLLGLRQAGVKPPWAATADRPGLSLAWRNDWQIEKQFTVEDEDGEEDEEDKEEDENDDVTSWSGSWIRRGHIKAGNELDWYTTSPTSLTGTTTTSTSTLKCQSQKSWHSDLVCFLCNKRNFQKEFLFVFFFKGL